MRDYIVIPGKREVRVKIENVGRMLADALDERDRLINALLKAKPFVVEAASKMRPIKKVEMATDSLEFMGEWKELWP